MLKSITRTSSAADTFITGDVVSRTRSLTREITESIVYNAGDDLVKRIVNFLRDIIDFFNSIDSGSSPGGATTSTTPTATTAPTSSGGGGGTLPSTTVTVGTVTSGITKTVIIEQTPEIPVSEIELEVKETVVSAELTIKEVSAFGVSTVISPTSGRVYKYLDISTTIASANLNKVKIRFKVPKNWLSSNDLDPATVALNRLVSSSWTKLSTSKASEKYTDIFYLS